MIKEFLPIWEKNKHFLLERLQKDVQKEENTSWGYDISYEGLLQLIIEEVLNKDVDSDESWEGFFTKIQTVDFGDYQGTLIMCFAKNTYQPSASETYYTYVDYGSCSGCDTLQGILYTAKTEKQPELLFTLCLHLFQNIHCIKEVALKDDDYENNYE